MSTSKQENRLQNDLCGFSLKCCHFAELCSLKENNRELAKLLSVKSKENIELKETEQKCIVLDSKLKILQLFYESSYKQLEEALEITYSELTRGLKLVAELKLAVKQERQRARVLAVNEVDATTTASMQRNIPVGGSPASKVTSDVVVPSTTMSHEHSYSITYNENSQETTNSTRETYHFSKDENFAGVFVDEESIVRRGEINWTNQILDNPITKATATSELSSTELDQTNERYNISEQVEDIQSACAFEKCLLSASLENDDVARWSSRNVETPSAHALPEDFSSSTGDSFNKAHRLLECQIRKSDEVPRQNNESDISKEKARNWVKRTPLSDSQTLEERQFLLTGSAAPRVKKCKGKENKLYTGQLQLHQKHKTRNSLLLSKPSQECWTNEDIFFKNRIA